jgi:hypothetical protein
VDQPSLAATLATALPRELANDLTVQFIDIRRDVATSTLGRSAPGKFVETVAQALQALENDGTYDARPSVDNYFKNVESRQSPLPDGLRICAARLARAMYALRSKRNIVHKGDVNTSLYDLQLLYAGAQWVLTELLALAQGIGGEDAAQLISEVQLPAGQLVEVLGGRRLVHANMTVREEALVLLMSHYPEPIDPADVRGSMDRRNPGSVSNALSKLWREKLLHRGDERVVLTEPGLREAIRVAQAHVAQPGSG